MTSQNLISLLGILFLPVLAWGLSSHRKVIPVRTVLVGLGLMATAAVFIFLIPIGARVFLIVNDGLLRIMEAAMAGVTFVFGPLASGPGQAGSIGFILITQGLPTIIFFSALMAVLQYAGILPRLVVVFARILTRPMKLSGAESLSASANLFLGVESSLIIRPHLANMTRSELCTILAAGMATVASNVLALYVFTLKDRFPAIAGHLVSASFMAIPAAILMSKLICPETGEPATRGIQVKPHLEREPSLFAAILSGSKAGVEMILGIVALLIAMIGLVALVDLGLGALGQGVGGWMGHPVDLSLKHLLGWVFVPLTWLMGVPAADVVSVAGLLGERLIVTEVAAYQDLAKAMASGTLTDNRSILIATYALCGFAHVPSLAIFVGGTAALAPTRLADMAAVGFRALVAATLACLLTGAMAGLFYNGSGILMGR